MYLMHLIYVIPFTYLLILSMELVTYLTKFI